MPKRGAVVKVSVPVCPFGSDRTKLDVNDMEDRDKYFIGSSIASGKRTVKSFVIRYGLKRRTVQSYATRVKQGKVLRGKSGRSSYLDKEDLAELQDFFKVSS
jgi:menaquinone-dependent protoporphyrinogen IX oxidase